MTPEEDKNLVDKLMKEISSRFPNQYSLAYPRSLTFKCAETEVSLSIPDTSKNQNDGKHIKYDNKRGVLVYHKQADDYLGLFPGEENGDFSTYPCINVEIVGIKYHHKTQSVHSDPPLSSCKIILPKNEQIRSE